jgi:hypothetical protein
MAEDAYREFKEEQGNLTAAPVSRFGDPEYVKLIRVRQALGRRLSQPAPDYAVFKAALSAAVREIKVEIYDQHQQTRAEVQTVRRDVLAAVKASPVQYVKLLCEFGSLLLFFCLAVRLTLRIELVNSAFALFMLPALAVYWAMAHVKQKSEKTKQDSGEA